MQKSTVAIIGGGLAGLCASIQLALAGVDVQLFEKNRYPKHKVCGEYVSNEVLSYLHALGLDPFQEGAKDINVFSFSDFKGRQTQVNLPLGGFGMSRFALDNYLYQRALQVGVKFTTTTITDVTFNEDFTLTSQQNDKYRAVYVLAAYGKRSVLDKTLNRKFMRSHSEWMAVKAHYHYNFPEDEVALHNFMGGYCGLSQVETGAVNACYLVSTHVFKKYKDLISFRESVLYKNKNLKSFFSSAEMIFDKPLVISQVSFDQKRPVFNHMLMLGDTAGLIHPLCGNGMAMAMHSACIAVSLILDNLASSESRVLLEKQYAQQWQSTFGNRLRNARILQKAMHSERLTAAAIPFMRYNPWLLKKIIKNTHGTPFYA